jgi:large subunit ribosomal protein L6
MSCAASKRCLTQLIRDPARSRSLPTFLVPAFSQPLRAQCFSTTSAAQSRVGGAPISVPPEVSLKFVDLPQTQVRSRTKEIPKMAIEVKGPLGMFQLCLAFDLSRHF